MGELEDLLETLRTDAPTGEQSATYMLPDPVMDPAAELQGLAACFALERHAGGIRIFQGGKFKGVLERRVFLRSAGHASTRGLGVADFFNLLGTPRDYLGELRCPEPGCLRKAYCRSYNPADAPRCPDHADRSMEPLK